MAGVAGRRLWRGLAMVVLLLLVLLPTTAAAKGGPFKRTDAAKTGAGGRSKGGRRRRMMFPIPTPAPGPSSGIKAPYRGFYKDLASISNYVGSITVSWGKALDQFAKASFDMQRLEFFVNQNEKLLGQFIANEAAFAEGFQKLRFEKGLQTAQLKEVSLLNTFKNTAWEGKAIMAVMSITSLLSISFAIVDIIQSATTKDPTQAKLDFIVNTVAQINATATQTLKEVRGVQESVNRIEDILKSISQQLELILTEIQNTQCYIANSNVDAVWTTNIKRLWYQYTVGDSSLASKLSRSTVQFLEEPTTPADRSLYDEALAWAQEVRDTVYSDLDSIHNYLVDTTVPGALSLCSTAFYSKWANNRGSAFPFDDRQLFYPITSFLLQKTLYQVNGMQMMREALTILAMDAARVKAIETNETALSYFGSDSTLFCDLVLADGGNRSSPLYAGLGFCSDITTFGNQVYDNIVQQTEIMGQPFSQGEAGQGIRLLIGTDLAPFNAYVPTNHSDLANQTLTVAPFPTRWLLPASPGEFDPRCSSGSVEEAETVGCPLVGTWASCTTGCGLDPQQEALWAALPPSILGFPKEAWGIADGAIWDGLRGMLAGFSLFRNETGPADAFTLMESAPSSSYAISFANYSDRPWWIVNQSAAVALSDLAFGWESLPIFRSFPTGNIVPWFTNGREERIPCTPDSDRTYCQPQFLLDGNCDLAYGDKTPFNFQPLEMQISAQCFAASNPNPAGGWRAPGQLAGPTGIFCTSSDFASLFEQNCTTFDDASPCCKYVRDTATGIQCITSQYVKRNCSTGIKQALLDKFAAALNPTAGASGRVLSECFYRPGNMVQSGWDHWWEVKTRPYVGFREGICTLTSESHVPCFDAVVPDSPQQYSACSPGFLYPWFGQAQATYRPWTYQDSKPRHGALTPVPGWTPPSDSRTRRLFRLPVADITKMVCTPSPFINAGHANDPTAVRPRRNLAGFMVPCNDLMTQAIVGSVGPGYYEASSYGSSATLTLADDGDTITCDALWNTDVVTSDILITVRDGPVFDTDNPAFTYDRSSPLWVSQQISLFDPTRTPTPVQLRQNVSLRVDFPLRTNRSARIIGCTVVGIDAATTLPVRITATSKLTYVNGTLAIAPPTVARAAQVQNQTAAVDFGFPMYTQACATGPAGCITTALYGVQLPARLAVGRALGWAGRETRNDTVFVAPSDGEAGHLWLLGPSDGSMANLAAVVAGGPNSSAGNATALRAFRWLAGFGVDAQGSALFLAGTLAAAEGDGDGALARAPWLDGGRGRGYANASYLGPGGAFTCLTSPGGRAANRLAYLHMAGAWQHPGTGDVYAVDDGCGLLYRLDAAAMDPNCSPFGACGQAHFLANLTGAANLTTAVNPDGSPLRQNVSVVGDPLRGRLYLAYAAQCGIMALNLTTGATIGWAVASNVTFAGQNITLPLCGFAGDGGPAAGGTAALSPDVRQLAVDAATGDLYIADTGNHRVRRVEFASGLLSTVAGVGQAGYTGDDGPATGARLSEPSGVALVAVPDPRVPGRFWRWLYIADTGNHAVRRVQLNDALAVTLAPSQAPTQAPSKTPTRQPTRAPTAPTRRPTVAPTNIPTAVPWSVDALCKNCQASTIFDGIRKITCTCGIASPSMQPEEATCFSSCCPSQQTSWSGGGGMDCDSGGTCTTRNGEACPVGWRGNFSAPGGCRDCFVTSVPGQDAVVQLQCTCGPGAGSPSRCFSNCCRSRRVDYVNGGLACAFGSCMTSLGGACTPTTAPTRAPTAPTLAPTRAPSTVPTRAPSKRPSTAPTRAPTRAPTTFVWSGRMLTSSSCSNCRTTTAFNGDAELTCDCLGYPTSCFSSCCPSGQVTAIYGGYDTPTNPRCGMNACSVSFPDPVWFNTVNVTQHPCVTDWTLPGFCICHEDTPVGGVRRVTCQCPNSSNGYEISSCFESCCPGKQLVLNATTGTVACSTGATCYPADGFPC